ncbi:MAG: rod shape-determining protein [Minisyncoccus archaeiphilus]|uniref:rod shape-determining protein n=1 Tax=Minisyncoccus archaeiphilus TaxID=3238481 RepID=UPI0009CC8173|nr:MAG: Rod shape-determining protein MreB [Parcubacteria group bacterium ADurb.Bin216]GMX59769.1 MAG: rod shape-determining protein [Candidatus Parcubacteria bacterium]
MFNKILSSLSQDVAIDLGTANCLVYVKGRGIILSEPSVVALNKKNNQVLAIGREAEKMVGRTPGHIVAIRPLVSGVVSDFEVTEQMLRYLIDRSRQDKFNLFKPRVIIGIPSGVTEVEKKAVIDAAKSAGARDVFLIEEPMASAIGARMPVNEPAGNFVVDIGGGTTEVGVISLGGIVVSKSLRVAGDKLNQDIIDYAQEKFKLLIGVRTAERIKINIGIVYFEKDPDKKDIKEIAMRGRNLVTGLPEEVIINQLDVKKALEKSVNQIINEIKNTVEITPPELLSDIMKKGIYLAGGGAQLRGLDKLVTKETKMPCYVMEDPMTGVARGAGMVLENLDEYHEVLVETEDLYGERG